jgi:hypothetical protein
MRKLFVSKMMVMVAGVLAAVIVVLSQSFQFQAKQDVQKVKTEQQADEQPDVLISASADAVSPSSAIQLDEKSPALLQEVLTEEKNNFQHPIVRPEVVARYFKVLFRTIISPNAP